MDNAAVSVSKGVFVYKNNFKSLKKRAVHSSKQTETCKNIYSNTAWYRSYRTLWNQIEAKINDLNSVMFSDVLSNLIAHLENSYTQPVTEIPTAALLTGINMPDHGVQFSALTNEIWKQVSPHVATVHGEDCPTLKSLVDNVVRQFVTGLDSSNLVSVSSDDDDLEKVHNDKKNCTMKRSSQGAGDFRTLKNWYENLYNFANLTISSPPAVSNNNHRKSLVVIVPDFENFSDCILQDFILIASSYLNVLPFVFVFGISTSLSTLHRSLPHQVSSKINVRVFHSQPSTVYLNNVLDNVLFTGTLPFHLGGKVFNLFTDIFLFYDLSVSGFIQNLKYAMLEHFSYGNAMALCTSKNTTQIVRNFNHVDLENVRRLLSFRRLVEDDSNAENRIKLLEDDVYFRRILIEHIDKIVKYSRHLHLFIRCLLVLVGDLPRAPLGTQIRELYALIVSKNLTVMKEYQECIQLLKFQSKDKLVWKLSKIVSIIRAANCCPDHEEINKIVCELDGFINQITTIDANEQIIDSMLAGNRQLDGGDNLGKMDRKQLKEKLTQLSKQQLKPNSRYDSIKLDALNYLSHHIFANYLIEPNHFKFHEIFFFNDMSIKNHIIGSHRAAIHAALNDPHSYLQCSCCQIADYSMIKASMPDISIVYKLHLECGKMINLYDWLQAFLTILDAQQDDGDAKRLVVKPELQARFTQSVAELEFLGFIKGSKRKTDHVARLTWGG